METVTLTRGRWVAVARELDTKHREETPPGLRERIARLIADTPAEWDGERCDLELDPSAAAVVYAIVQRSTRDAREVAFEQSQRESISEAESVIREHQNRPLED